jgi:hypothetical protein
MTRTARSSFPRAIVKDRSESKSGHDKRLRKDGGGPHGWGRLSDENELESAALYDEQLEFNQENASKLESVGDVGKPEKIQRSVSGSSTSEEELESARKFRKNALKGTGIDLAAIARTSAAVSTSPTSPTMSKNILLGHGAETYVTA